MWVHVAGWARLMSQLFASIRPRCPFRQYRNARCGVGGSDCPQRRVATRNEPRQDVALIAKIARADQYAHGKGILHRDLKPGNILLDGHGEPLISDFGLARWLDTTSDLTRTLTIFGTPGYIAPEQASAA